jgi:hypothetical protein
VTSTIEPDGLRSGRNWGMAMIRDRLDHMTATQRLGSTQYPSGTTFAMFAEDEPRRASIGSPGVQIELAAQAFRQLRDRARIPTE